MFCNVFCFLFFVTLDCLQWLYCDKQVLLLMLVLISLDCVVYAVLSEIAVEEICLLQRVLSPFLSDSGLSAMIVHFGVVPLEEVQQFIC